MRTPKNTGGIGNKCEELDGMCSTATITGGDAATRRVLRDYSKATHKAEAKAAIDLKDILEGKVDVNVSRPAISTTFK